MLDGPAALASLHGCNDENLDVLHRTAKGILCLCFTMQPVHSLSRARQIAYQSTTCPLCLAALPQATKGVVDLLLCFMTFCAIQASPPRNLIELAIQQMHAVLKTSPYEGLLGSVTAAEWWAHSRQVLHLTLLLTAHPITILCFLVFWGALNKPLGVKASLSLTFTAHIARGVRQGHAAMIPGQG